MREINIKHFIENIKKNGPTIPLEKEKFDKVDKENYNFLKDIPKGSGLYYTFLYEAIKNFRPKNIVELGNRKGLSTLCMLHAMNDEQSLTTIDVKHGLQFIPEYYKNKKNFKSFVGSSTDEEIFQDCDPDIDFLFIDTEHKYKQIMREWGLWRTKLSDGCIVAADDINWPGMKKFIEEIKHFQWINSVDLHASGFLIFQYKKERVKNEN